MAGLCRADNIAMAPYSALASGRLSRHPGETSKRLQEDSYAKFKYDATEAQDAVIIERVAELAERHGVSMTEVSLAWLLTKVTSPVVGATKLHHIEGAAKAVDLQLSDEELAWLEEPYVPHALVGVMAQNTAATYPASFFLMQDAGPRLAHMRDYKWRGSPSLRKKAMYGQLEIRKFERKLRAVQ